MPGENTFTRIPPASTGNRISIKQKVLIPYTNRTGEIISDDTYVGAISGVEFDAFKLFATNATQGYIEAKYDDNSIFDGLNVSQSEDINDENGVKVAEVSPSLEVIPIFTNESILVGSNNNTYGMNVDVFGSAYTRFSEGAPEITGFGQIRVSEGTLIAQYIFQDNVLPTQFANTLLGSGQIEFLPDSRVVKESNGTDIGALTTHTSNLYHPFIPGSSNLFVLGTRVGDQGKAGVVRNWGCFDATDGFMFRSNQTNLNIVHRWTMEGNPTENHQVSQSEWNRDTVDGSGGLTNPSGMNLDISKANTYWIDFTFLGGGKTRWGVFYKGDRIVCHEMYMHNGLQTGVSESINNPLSSPNRPICWSMKNVGTPGSTSELYALGAGVYYEGDNTIRDESPIKGYSNSNITIPSGSGGTYYAFSARPTLNLTSGNPNQSIYTPKTLDIAAYNATNEDDVNMELRVFNSCVLRGENYEKINYTELEVDTDGDHLAHNPEVVRIPFKGRLNFDWDEIFSGIQYGTIRNNSEASTAQGSQLLASITNTNPTVATVATNSNPLFGNNRHFFNDRGIITIQDVTATDVSASLNNNEYYLALTSGDDALLYTTTSSLDDDRVVRQTILSTTSSVSIGDQIWFTGYGTASILDLSNNTASLQSRLSSSVDIAILGGTSFDTTSGGSGTVGAAGLFTQSSSYPKDYTTTLGAVDGSGWGAAATDGKFRGTPPAQPPYVFMIRPFSAKAFDIDTRWDLRYHERTQ